MIALDALEQSTFEPLLGQEFAVSAGQVAVTLTLVEARKLGHRRPDAKRDPFSLTFRGKPGWRLPQHIYRFEHEALGSLEFFITQVADKGTGSEFEAVFT
jgi:hypothetical protein